MGMNVYVKKRKYNLITFFIFILYLYFLIPTESLSQGIETSLLIRFLACGILILTLLIMNGFVKSQKLIICMLFFSCIYLVSALSSISLKVFISFEALLLGLCWAYSFYTKPLTSAYLVAAIKLLIYISALSLILQLIIYQFFGYIDFHSLIYPWSSARYEDSQNFLRLGGIYIEPGTLSNWIYAFTLLLILVEDKLNIRLISIAALAMLLSLSAWGVAISIIIFIFLALQHKIIFIKKNNIYFKLRPFILTITAFLLTAIFLIVFITDDIYTFLETKFSFETGSGEVRLVVYDEFLAILPDILLFGLGYASDFCSDCQSPQDAGLFISFTVVYGLMFSIFFFLIIILAFYKKLGIKGIILVLPLLTSKIYYWDYILFLIFFSAFYRIFLLSKVGKSVRKYVDSSQRFEK